MTEKAEILILGGGFYGCALALHLRQKTTGRIVILEREKTLLQRASRINQARVHGGYHYPRSFTTAWRSQANYARFLNEYRKCCETETIMLYGIARHHSAVTARRFARFCSAIGAPLTPASPAQLSLFNPRQIEAVFQVREATFNARLLADNMADDLAKAGVETITECDIIRYEDGILFSEKGEGWTAPFMLNATYAGLNRIAGLPPLTQALKYELAELSLITPPAALDGVGVTIMDGAFFSTIPYPAEHPAYSLTHVRYTPRASWRSDMEPNRDPYAELARIDDDSRVGRMIRDSARILPCLADAKPVGRLVEVKTVLVGNEQDDGRPILLARHGNSPVHAILGGKLDNIYDIMAAIDMLRS